MNEMYVIEEIDDDDNNDGCNTYIGICKNLEDAKKYCLKYCNKLYAFNNLHIIDNTTISELSIDRYLFIVESHAEYNVGTSFFTTEFIITLEKYIEVE